MSYDKQTWSLGDTITAEKMNHIEDGIEQAGTSGGGSGTFIVEFTVSNAGKITACSKTYNEVLDAYNNITPIIGVMKSEQLGKLYLPLLYWHSITDGLDLFYFSTISPTISPGTINAEMVIVELASDNTSAIYNVGLSTYSTDIE